MAVAESYGAARVASAGSTPADGFSPGPVTPLLTKGGAFEPALSGAARSAGSRA